MPERERPPRTRKPRTSAASTTSTADRWRNYIDDPADLELLDGDRLLHTDDNPLNILMADGRALLVDWAWPTGERAGSTRPA